MTLWDEGIGRPSGTFRKNVMIGASCMSRREAEMRHEIGVGNMMWGSDYPHHEGTHPHTREALRQRDNLRVFARITRELVRETELEALLRLIVDSAIALVGGV